MMMGVQLQCMGACVHHFISFVEDGLFVVVGMRYEWSCESRF
jgi:hypothetical protein